MYINDWILVLRHPKRVINLNVLCDARTGTRCRLTQKPVELEEVYWRNGPRAGPAPLSAAPVQARARGLERRWSVMAGFPLGGMLTGPDCSTLWPRSVLPSSQARGAKGVGSQEPDMKKQLGGGPLGQSL